MANILVILGAGAEAAGEALRTSVGLVGGGHRVRLLARGGPESLRAPGCEYLLETFARLGGTLAPAGDLPAAMGVAEVVIPWGD